MRALLRALEGCPVSGTWTADDAAAWWAAGGMKEREASPPPTPVVATARTTDHTSLEVTGTFEG
jgi:hypothetical protein